MAETRKILWRFLGDSKSLDKASKRGVKSMDGLTKAAGVAGLALGGREALQWAGDAVQLAIASDEVESKFQAVYGASVDLRRSLSAWGDMAGVTDDAAKNMAATFGNLAMAQGVSADTTKELVVDVAALAGDMASFNDVDPAIVFEDLNKALLTTEREGMKKYGIAVTEAEVKTRALAIATRDGRTEVTKADRAMASYEIVVQQAGKAVGDLERTQDSLANQQRQLKATVEELQTEIGRELLPAYRDLLSAASDLTPVFKGVAKLTGETTTLMNLLAGAANEADDPLRALSSATELSAEAFGRQALEIATKVNPALWAFDMVVGVAGNSISDMADRAEDATGSMQDWRDAAWAAQGAAQGITKEFNATPYLEYAAGLRAAAAAADELAGDAAAAASKGSAIVQAMRDFISLRDVINGGTTSFGGVSESGSRYMHSGGVVAGTGNQPRILQSGERVIPRGGGSGGGGITINVTGFVGSEDALAQTVADVLTRYELIDGSRRSGLPY